MKRVLILRPQPGADRTAERAEALGLQPVVAPIFTLRPLDWTPPPLGDFDAVVLTSANAARLAGEGLTPFRRLPCYAVGGRTAVAAQSIGFHNLHIGPGNGANLLATMAAEGVKRAFHPCGRDYVEITHPELAVTRIPVYAADAAERLPGEAQQAIENGVIALIHSPRAGAVFGALVGDLRSRVRIVAISPAAAEAAGSGWRAVAAAEVPRDPAMLELAVKLCQNASREVGSEGG